MPYADLTPKELDRFWSKVNTSAGPDACWPWVGGKHIRGYGIFSVHRPGVYRSWRSHRIAYEQSHGTDPGKLMVLHACDNPPCCNPSHLFLGTHQDNVDDKVAKGRQARAVGAKLDAEKVREIRAAYDRGDPIYRFAKAFGVTRRTVYLVAWRETWKHVS